MGCLDGVLFDLEKGFAWCLTVLLLELTASTNLYTYIASIIAYSLISKCQIISSECLYVSMLPMTSMTADFCYSDLFALSGSKLSVYFVIR